MMQVLLTVDVEAYCDPPGEEIYGGGLGLPFLLREFSKRGFRATFFVEALGATRWGSDYLRDVCGKILAAGQEVQLHLHPTVARIDGFRDRNDKLYEQDRETQSDLICRGVAILRDCGTPPITAFRAGDLAADSNTLAAMVANGVLLGSNRDLDCKGSIQSRINELYPVANEISVAQGVTDAPVTCFRSPLPRLDGTYRHLQVTAVSAGEMLYALSSMDAAGYHAVTILTHPGEFFRRTPAGFVPKQKNVRRLRQLLDYLVSTPSLRVITMTQLWDATPVLVAPGIPRMPLYLTLRRVLEQLHERLAHRSR